MGDPALLPFSAAALAATAMVAAAGLRAWRGWLELRREQLSAGRSGLRSRAHGDLAALRRRVRRLEAIAEGADL